MLTGVPGKRSGDELRKRDAKIAHHEAGHATAAVVRGCGVISTTIDGPNPRACYATEADAIVALAGPFAQVRFALLSGEYGREANTSDWHALVFGTDGISHLEGALRLEGNCARDFARAESLIGEGMPAARATTGRLIEQHWEAIQRVATALLELGSLDGAEVDAIVKGLMR